LVRIGTHCILELYQCEPDSLSNPDTIVNALQEASRRGLSTLLKTVHHRFEPQGVTALALLAESHISIHTWPEHRYAAADVFTCGSQARPRLACAYLVEAFSAGRHKLVEVDRGVGIPFDSGDARTPAAGETGADDGDPAQTGPRLRKPRQRVAQGSHS
jgi:S-adenosylmethionine decarboxylase